MHCIIPLKPYRHSAILMESLVDSMDEAHPCVHILVHLWVSNARSFDHGNAPVSTYGINLRVHIWVTDASHRDHT